MPEVPFSILYELHLMYNNRQLYNKQSAEMFSRSARPSERGRRKPAAAPFKHPSSVLKSGRLKCGVLICVSDFVSSLKCIVSVRYPSRFYKAAGIGRCYFLIIVVDIYEMIPVISHPQLLHV